MIAPVLLVATVVVLPAILVLGLLVVLGSAVTAITDAATAGLIRRDTDETG